LAYILNGTAKQFSVSWSDEEQAVYLTSGKAYEAVGGEMANKALESVTANPTKYTIYLDGEKVDLTAYLINDNNYFKLRDIMKLFDVYVGYDEKTDTITIDTSKGYTD